MRSCLTIRRRNAGFLEKEGSLRNRSDQEPWLATTEPYRGARPRIRDFDRLVEKELEDGGDFAYNDVGGNSRAVTTRFGGAARWKISS